MFSTLNFNLKISAFSIVLSFHWDSNNHIPAVATTSLSVYKADHQMKTSTTHKEYQYKPYQPRCIRMTAD